jgi:hypothetical protein
VLRRLGIAALVFGHSEHIQSVELFWALFQNLLIPGLSFGKIAGPVICDRSSEQVCDIVTLPIGGHCAENLQLLTHASITFWHGCQQAERDSQWVARSLAEASTRVVNKLLTMLLGLGPGIQIRARMFAPHLNIPEDPATGSANVALIGLLAKLRPEANLSLSKTIAQGVEMGRTSILQATAEKRNGVVTATFIGGRCVPVMSGTIDLA